MAGMVLAPDRDRSLLAVWRKDRAGDNHGHGKAGARAEARAPWQ
jgi:hypothetical protein